MRRTMLVVSWLLEAMPDDTTNTTNATNAHMQLLIDEFRNIYDANDEACRVRGMTSEEEEEEEEGDSTAPVTTFHEPERFLRGDAGWMTSRTSNVVDDVSSGIPSVVPSGIPSYDPTGAPSGIPSATSGPSVSSGPTIDPGPPWDPFHPDIQKTIHFWGYDGSLTEVPCTDDAWWRIMDAPVRLSIHQLEQMREALFDNRDPRRD